MLENSIAVHRASVCYREGADITVVVIIWSGVVAQSMKARLKAMSAHWLLASSRHDPDTV